MNTSMIFFFFSDSLSSDHKFFFFSLLVSLLLRIFMWCVLLFHSFNVGLLFFSCLSWWHSTMSIIQDIKQISSIFFLKLQFIFINDRRKCSKHYWEKKFNFIERFHWWKRKIIELVEILNLTNRLFFRKEIILNTHELFISCYQLFFFVSNYWEKNLFH